MLDGHARLVAIALVLVVGATFLSATSRAEAQPGCTSGCTIWPGTATPAVASDPDSGQVEIGVKFRSDLSGFIMGLSFYKGAANTGTHVGRLWTSTGTQLASVTFTGETASGWQQANFASPVAITANTVYVASYHATVGKYSVTDSYFARAGVDNGPLHALADGDSGGNGVYWYGVAAFPNLTFRASNYWVDVVFSTSTAPSVSSVTPANGATGVSTGTTVTATFNKAMDPASITSTTFTLQSSAGAVAAAVSYNATTRTATLTPSAALALGTTYTATVKGGATGAKDSTGTPMAADFVWSFTTAAAGSSSCCTIWPSTATPAVASENDPSAVELGVRFRSDVGGSITALRFYKGASNTGTHVGNLWTATGTLLASVTFTGETASGWQQANFATPVAITANTVYVASYHADVGRYAVTESYFATASVDNPPLHALANGVTGGNGVYTYGASAFPTSTFNSSNYWVDVVFSPQANPIESENALSGSPDIEWDIDGAGDPSIQGFATDISVNRGQTVHFKIDTNATAYRIDIYRMGYYGGMGARFVTSIQPSVGLPQNQPNCLQDTTTGLIDCGNWAESAAWTVPETATSGIYFAKLVRLNTGGASHIVFVVRDDASTSDILFQTSDTTWQAYNSYGGNSLYEGGPATSPNRAYKVSYNRPFNTRRSVTAHDWVFNAEYPMVRWLEANGYHVSYTTGADSDRNGSLIRQHMIFMSVGHDEYWSGDQRANVEAARDAGVNLAYFSGNEVFWKTRWESSIDGSGTPYRTLVCYKETHANVKIDPSPLWTGTWRDPRFSPPPEGGRPENALTGTIFIVNDIGCCSQAIIVPAALGKLRFWRNTSIANLAKGTTATLPAGTLGYEWDEELDNGFRPPGLMILSSTTQNLSEHLLLDYGSTYGSGPATHSLTLYRARSGALVFGAGTVQWSWGLDDKHDVGSSTVDGRMQQATVNLLADMGAHPRTLQPGLVIAAQSTDTVAPTSTITSPAPGATVDRGTTVTITGTAADTGGGVLAVVEVSVDGGLTWHRASGLANWRYTWMPTTAGTVTIGSSATDDSGNTEIPSAGVTVTVR
jgi:hypothetical protein